LADSLFSTDPVPAGTRLACRVEYDGSHYKSQIADAPVRVYCAGRTDSGVHGCSQVSHVDAPYVRSCKAWVIGSNAALPQTIRVHWAIPVPTDFHARFSAQTRCYRYVIANTPVRPALMAGQVTWHRRPLDERVMHKAAQVLLGERDFSAFRAASCQSRTPMRRVDAVEVRRRGDLVILEITANAFLHHMVRNIVGTLLAVGDLRRPADWVLELLLGRDRTAAADTAPAAGLYLVDVRYPERFGLPPAPYGPMLLGPNP